MSRYDWGQRHPGIERLEWQQCAETVIVALDARARLWDGILAAIKG